MIADLAPITKYEFLLAQQLVDLNWSILQAKTSADVELSKGAENLAKIKLTKALENECDENTIGSTRPSWKMVATKVVSRIPSTGMV